jgi:hypothetical protein
LNKKNILIGLVFILIGIWFYSALSSFATEEDSFPKKIILREGVVRTEFEVAEALSKEMDFDLEGAYKTGYTSIDVAEYLIKEPHDLSVTFYDGRFYEGRKTVPYIIPLAVCMLLILIGAGMILFNLKPKKS